MSQRPQIDDILGLINLNIAFNVTILISYALNRRMCACAYVITNGIFVMRSMLRSPQPFCIYVTRKSIDRSFQIHIVRQHTAATVGFYLSFDL